MLGMLKEVPVVFFLHLSFLKDTAAFQGEQRTLTNTDYRRDIGHTAACGGRREEEGTAIRPLLP